MTHANHPLIIVDDEAADEQSHRNAALAERDAALAECVSITRVILSRIWFGVSRTWGFGRAKGSQRRLRKKMDAHTHLRQKTGLARHDAHESDEPVDKALRAIRRQADRQSAAVKSERFRQQQDKDRRKAEAISTRFEAEGTLPSFLCPVRLRENERCLHASRASIRYTTSDGSKIEDLGYLLLTNERLVFSGDHHTVHTPLSEIASMTKSGPEAFVVTTGTRTRGATYRVSYPCEFLAYAVCVCKLEKLSPAIVY